MLLVVVVVVLKGPWVLTGVKKMKARELSS
jgi:hypothetical protein